ncbi:hypothetical protein Syun_012339 [Stephania yunnanensis]|uniref:Uncharacterized protein n=1 Tax=Stephania yunnanensis TaxID=152371 RepID=A0AAP0K011_9MAGN
MFGKVGGRTNTRGWSSLLSIFGVSDFSELTLMFISSSLSFSAMTISGSIGKTSHSSDVSIK